MDKWTDTGKNSISLAKVVMPVTVTLQCLHHKSKLLVCLHAANIVRTKV